MATITKTLYNRNSTEALDSYIWGSYYRSEPVNCVNSAWSIAERNRPKPSPLSDTKFEFTRQWQDKTIIRIGIDPNVVRGYSGPIFYVSRMVGGVTPKNVVTSPSQGYMALLNASNKLTDSPMDLGESLFELKETVSLVSSRGKQLLNVAQNLKRRNFPEVWKQLNVDPTLKMSSRVKSLAKGKELANGWLELQFGWAPLVSDIYGAVESYHKGLLKEGSKLSSMSGRRPSHSRSAPSKADLDQLLSEGGLATGRIRGRITNKNAASLQAYGLANPASILWQKLPVSFVVDYFMPIGKILNLLTYDAGISDLRGSYTHGIVQANISNLNGQVCDLYVNTHRTPALPSMVEAAKMLGLASSLNTFQITTIGALLRQSFSSSKK